MSILAWLIGSQLGRMVAMGGLAALAIGIVLLSAFNKGVSRERARAAAKRLRNIKTRIKTDEKVRKMPVADRRRELNRWVRE